jgi:hypothetical protein
MVAALAGCRSDVGNEGNTEPPSDTGMPSGEAASASASASGQPSSDSSGSGAPSSTDTTSSPPDTDDPPGTSSESTDTGPLPPRDQVRCGDPDLPFAMSSFADPIELQADGGTGGSAVGDLDGDGRDEFVAQIQFRIYDFDGTEWTSYQPLDDLSGRGDRFAGDIEVADIDGDDDLDIVVPDSDNSGSQGALGWFENPGMLDGTWTEHVVSTFDGNGEGNAVTHLSELEVGDIDGDGRPDLVVRDISHGVWVFVQQDGGWAPRKFIPVNPREGLELWDPDENGRLDILLNGVWLETPDDPVAGDYTLHTIAGMEAWYAPDLSTASVRDYACKVEAGDFDGDGRVDVAITNSEELAGSSPNKPHGISVFLQPDTLDGTWQEVVLTDERWAWHTLVLADLDFDGSLDVFSAISNVGTDGGGDEIAFWLNGGDGTSFAGQTVSTAYPVYQGALGDADDDGDCDFFAPHHFNSGAVRYFENTTVP